MASCRDSPLDQQPHRISMPGDPFTRLAEQANALAVPLPSVERYKVVEEINSATESYYILRRLVSLCATDR